MLQLEVFTQSPIGCIYRQTYLCSGAA